MQLDHLFGSAIAKLSVNSLRAKPNSPTCLKRTAATVLMRINTSIQSPKLTATSTFECDADGGVTVGLMRQLAPTAVTLASPAAVGCTLALTGLATRAIVCSNDSRMAKKPKRARTVRREAERAAVSLARDRERLFALEPGGSPERPIDVQAVSVVELRAVAVRCPRCDGEHRVDEHAAVTTEGGARLREMRLACRECGSKRSLWFRLPVLN
jgi:hypothetical protein